MQAPTPAKAFGPPEKLLKVEDPVSPRQKIPTYNNRLKPLAPLVLPEEEEETSDEEEVSYHTSYVVDHHALNDSSGFFLTQGRK